MVRLKEPEIEHLVRSGKGKYEGEKSNPLLSRTQVYLMQIL